MSGLLSATLDSSPTAQAHDLRREHAHIIHDRCTGHTHPTITELLPKLNISETFVEPTFLLQVLDVGLAHPIRAAVLLRQLDYFFEHPKFTEGEKIGAPLFRKMNIQWICAAFYEDISKELIVKVSLKCGTCNHPKLTQLLHF